jgi:hypothetical protein
MLARFAEDMALKNGQPLPSQDIPEPFLGLMHASIGAAIVGKLIDTFESRDPKINPCIKELDAGLVFEMFAVTIGTVLGLAIGPALGAVAVVLKIASTVQTLANLAK